MKLIKIIFALGISVVTAAAFADDDQMPPTPQQFVWKASVAGMKEVCLGQIALEKSQDAAVRNFAKRMVRDHSKANEKLMQIANQEDLTFPPTNTFSMLLETSGTNENQNAQNAPFTSSAGFGTNNLKGAEELMQQLQSPTNTDSLTVQRLQSMSEPEFDMAYANQAVEDHVEAVQLFETASADMPDKDLKKFAKKTLPTLREHRRMALNLQSRFNGMQTTNSVTHIGYPAGAPGDFRR